MKIVTISQRALRNFLVLFFLPVYAFSEEKPPAAQAAKTTSDGIGVIESALSETFDVTVSGRKLTIRVLSPEADHMAKEPALLLTFATDRNTSLTTRPYCLSAEYFLANGHRAASFDLPAHGDRVDQYGGQISGMRNAFVAGVDPFAMFAEDGKAVIDECIHRGLATAGRIAIAGTSRGGYMALRLLAADSRIAAGAGYAPVTDWRDLTEFAEDKSSDGVAGLRLSNFVSGMAKKHVFVAIGRTDTRVSTKSCEQFVAALKAAIADASQAEKLVSFQLTDDPGHTLGPKWYGMGREFLLKSLTKEVK
jgi:dienelactone hydrolase